MKVIRAALLLVFACLGGLLVAEALFRSARSRDAIREFAARHGIGPEERDDLVLGKNLRAAASGEAVGEEEIEWELDLLRFQFADELAFNRALASSGYSAESLRVEIIEHLRARYWIEKQIAPVLDVAREKVFYDANRAHFTQPQRYRASHVFLAAPQGTTPEATALKQSAIQGLSVRMLAGESLAPLATEASEDEATKSRVGDLGYFSAARMAPEFMTEVEKMRVGEISAPLRLHLGFHIVQLTDAKPPREMSFEEVQPEIALTIANAKRAEAVGEVAERLKAKR